ncbi:hypothetical protein GF068_08425 [Polyangium spumosum]|uniref:Uncharacterized protein n=2 Tax=Polyangium spumosum TaxID=889282 RepID=A0A6N7PIW4_9BACT|nr:hypothetical protein [Polyangium spumosum]
MQMTRAILACLALSLTAVGCASPATEYCDVKCDCNGCSAENYDECVITYESRLDKADIYGCTNKFDDLHDCIMRKSDCALGNNVFDEAALACADDYLDLDSCERDGSARR